jgi:prepilin-type N-terminal cleavage/methylation domain-containing protein
MKIRKCRKKVKGMTLIEVIISLFIFTVMATVMVRVGQVSKSLIMQTNHLNNKVTAEAPVAAVQNANALTATASGLVDAAGDPVGVTSQSVDITVTSGGYSATVSTTRYSTDVMAQASSANCDTNMQGDLQFYVIETQPTT